MSLTHTLALIVFFSLTLTACQTTQAKNDYKAGGSDKPSVSDGPAWKNPGREQRVRNAFGTYSQ